MAREDWVFVPLVEEYRKDVAAFQNEHARVQEWIRYDAFESDEQDITRTYLLIDTAPDDGLSVIGYFALSARELAIGGQSFPMVQVAWLGRDVRRRERTVSRGEYIGDALIDELLEKVWEVSTIVGVNGVYLLPTREGTPLYERSGFSRSERGTYMYMDLARVRAAIGR